MLKFIVYLLLIVITQIDSKIAQNQEGSTLKYYSACCDIPELGDPEPIKKCNDLKLTGICDGVHCIFEESGFLTDKKTLNAEAYKNHLHKWSKKHSGWKDAVNKIIEDCVDKDVRQYLDQPCKAYDVFTCTGIAMIKRCPEFAWSCNVKS